MKQSALHHFTSTLAAAWQPLGSELVACCRQALVDLARADEKEDWLFGLIDQKPASRELHRDPVNGFVLLAHAENEGLFRPPHDHGRAWVVYAVQSGALEIRTYGKVIGPNGRPYLVLRDATELRPGEARAYLPGDIHDTRCLSETAMLFRFTERDLRREDLVDRKVTRFVEQDGVWTAPA